MYPYLHELLSDRKGGAVFTCFGPWHLGWIALTVLAGAVLILKLRRCDRERIEKTRDRLIALAFGLYVADFFLMPLAYGEIDIEKLPFHACTAMCVLCFLAGRYPALGRFRVQLAMLGLLSNFGYLIYPAGVMWHAVHPLSYRVVQTLAFHALVSLYGLVTVAFADRREFTRWKPLLALNAAMTAWAMLGNCAYNTEARLINWFFVVWDPFGLLPPEIAPWIMPFFNIALFFAAELLLCAALRRGEEVHAL